MNGLSRDELNARIKANDAEVDVRLNKVESRIDNVHESLQGKIENEAAKLLIELHKAKVDTLKWVIGLFVAMNAFSLYLCRDVSNQVDAISLQVHRLSEKLDRIEQTLNLIAERSPPSQ